MPYCTDGHHMNSDDQFCMIDRNPAVLTCSEGHAVEVRMDAWDNEVRPDYCPKDGRPFPWAS